MKSVKETFYERLDEWRDGGGRRWPRRFSHEPSRPKTLGALSAPYICRN